MPTSLFPAIFNVMKSFEPPVALPIDLACDISLELHLLRGECSQAAERLMLHQHPDEGALEECALLDDALAKAKGVLDCALVRISRSRNQRRRRTR